LSKRREAKCWQHGGGQVCPRGWPQWTSLWIFKGLCRPQSQRRDAVPPCDPMSVCWPSSCSGRWSGFPSLSGLSREPNAVLCDMPCELQVTSHARAWPCWNSDSITH
jgi:hypothetical protein